MDAASRLSFFSFSSLVDRYGGGGFGLAKGIDKPDPGHFLDGCFDDLERHGRRTVSDNLEAGKV